MELRRSGATLRMLRSSSDLSSLFSCRSSKAMLQAQDAEETSVIGRLTVRVRARDLPVPERLGCSRPTCFPLFRFLFAGHHYALLPLGKRSLRVRELRTVGDETKETQRVPGLNCQWDSDYVFPVNRVDTSLAAARSLERSLETRGQRLPRRLVPRFAAGQGRDPLSGHRRVVRPALSRAHLGLPRSLDGSTLGEWCRQHEPDRAPGIL